MKRTILITLAAASLQASAQLSVGSTASMTIAAGTPLAFEKLELTPSAALTLSNTSLSHSATPVTAQSGLGSIQRVYYFSSPITFTGSLRFNYFNSELNSNLESNLQLHQRSNGMWSTAGGTIDASNDRLDATLASSSFDALTLTQSGTVLPLVNSSFQGHWQGSAVQLQWAIDQNEAYQQFTLESRVDGGNWQALNVVTARAQSGRAHYTYLDARTAPLVRQYRLILQQLNGLTSYTPIVLLRRNGGGQVFTFSSGRALQLQFSNTAPQSVTVYNAGGQAVWSSTASSQQYSVPNLAAGFYTVQFRVSGDLVSQTVVHY